MLIMLMFPVGSPKGFVANNLEAPLSSRIHDRACYLQYFQGGSRALAPNIKPNSPSNSPNGEQRIKPRYMQRFVEQTIISLVLTCEWDTGAADATGD